MDWAMAAVLRGVQDAYAASLYQVCFFFPVVSSILLRPHPTDVNAPLSPATSCVPLSVFKLNKRDLNLKWIRKRWLGIRQGHGFDSLEGWASREISDRMPLSFFSPTYFFSYTFLSRYRSPNRTPFPQTSKGHSPKRQHGPSTTTSLLRPSSHHPHTFKVDAESDVGSSMRVSMLSRNLPMRQTSTTTTSFRDCENGLLSSASSVKSAVRSA